jgi:hypothetical protein
MNLIRIVFFGLAVLLPATWTVARAGDEAPAAETKKPKPAKKSKKADKPEGETKADTKAE